MRCKQCGKAKPDNGWVICGPCQAKNLAYEKECEALARALRFEFQKSPPARTLPKELRRPSEMRGRKARHAVVASHQKDYSDDD